MRRIVERIRHLNVSLWTLIVPPTVWAGHFLFSYIWAALHCAKVGDFSKYPVVFWGGTALALVIILGSGAIATIQAATPGGDPPHDQSTDVDRLRFLARSTQLLAALSFIGVVFTAAPVAVLTDCR